MPSFTRILLPAVRDTWAGPAVEVMSLAKMDERVMVENSDKRVTLPLPVEEEAEKD